MPLQQNITPADRLKQAHPDMLGMATLSIREAWIPLVERMIQELERLQNDRGPLPAPLCFTAIYERYGGLALDPRPEEIPKGDSYREPMLRAQQEALRTCHRCGEPGKVQVMGCDGAAVHLEALCPCCTLRLAAGEPPSDYREILDRLLEEGAADP
ncbi:hypothetical protein AN478_06990 [Thiohalorhabdus denitrificans]|uniref:Uncharacterized protein n=1 Tax=Thiohalorhabdus denitrificans TaxID=381306 RepID=A0A0P9CA82_9GAMM|nr:hypothetical protein [Thiohalorhabdus denitrificans]KPV39936.1 hypothetical protein AN478_06990 [Thiohalorhabdus denitrificans]SCY09056.1 hypothetical protein SAMN05661077_1158 [Thiohalorhabdus denitrificans]